MADTSGSSAGKLIALVFACAVGAFAVAGSVWYGLPFMFNNRIEYEHVTQTSLPTDTPAAIEDTTPSASDAPTAADTPTGSDEEEVRVPRRPGETRGQEGDVLEDENGRRLTFIRRDRDVDPDRSGCRVRRDRNGRELERICTGDRSYNE